MTAPRERSQTRLGAMRRAFGDAGGFAMDVRAAFGYVTPPTGWRAYAQDCRHSAVDRGLFRTECGQRRRNGSKAPGPLRARLRLWRTLLQEWRILHARMPVRFMHYANVSPRTLGDPAGHLPGRLGLLAVLLMPRRLQSAAGAARWRKPEPAVASPLDRRGNRAVASPIQLLQEAYRAINPKTGKRRNLGTFASHLRGKYSGCAVFKRH